jgi:tRNA (Thr-GGU) A37 N-methylase
VGIFAKRNKNRLNQIGLSTVELVWHRGWSIVVRFLDAINDTLVLDIKPVYREFRPSVDIRQPDREVDLMKNHY